MPFRGLQPVPSGEGATAVWATLGAAEEHGMEFEGQRPGGEMVLGSSGPSFEMVLPL